MAYVFLISRGKIREKLLLDEICETIEKGGVQAASYKLVFSI